MFRCPDWWLKKRRWETVLNSYTIMSCRISSFRRWVSAWTHRQNVGRRPFPRLHQSPPSLHEKATASFNLGSGERANTRCNVLFTQLHVRSLLVLHLQMYNAGFFFPSSFSLRLTAAHTRQRFSLCHREKLSNNLIDWLIVIFHYVSLSFKTVDETFLGLGREMQTANCDERFYLTIYKIIDWFEIVNWLWK